MSLGGVLAQDTDGEITGAVTDAAGEPMADQRVELQRPASEDDRRVVAVTDMNGRFVFSRLGPGRYEVQLREDGRVIATSRPIDLSAGTMRMSGLTVALPTAPPVPPPNRRRASADRLLGDAPVTRSFNALQAVLEPGHEVVVWDEAGRKTRGWVSSVSDAQIQITIFFKERFLRPGRTTERIFTPDSVTRVDIVDSYWNGALIGAAIGSILAFGIYRWEDSALADSNLKGIYTLGFGTASILFSIGIGALVDGRSGDVPRAVEIQRRLGLRLCNHL